MIRDYKDQDPDDALVTTLGQEKEINTFFRLQNSSVVEKLLKDFPEMGDQPDARAVFLKLRQLRNSW
jgi:hydroxyacylglutathione hydrolase